MGGMTILDRVGAATRSRLEEPELLDGPIDDPVELAGNLDDLARVNRWLSGVALTTRGIERLILGGAVKRRLSILDVGTGAADIPEALRGWARRRNRMVDLLAIDVNETILQQARTRAPLGVSFVAADGRCLPLPDGAVDVATASLVLHHLRPADAVSLLRELARVARLGVVVNDLVRSRHGYLGALLLANLTTRNRLTRHDAPLSVRRAYSLPELLDLARRAGLSPILLREPLGYRVALVARTAP